MSVVDAPVAGEERPRGQLRRELRLFEALAISVGIMGARRIGRNLSRAEGTDMPPGQ
jgi:hypothetical protein